MDQLFNTEFMSDQEVLDMLDTIVFTVGEAVEEEESRVHMLAENKLRQMQFTHAVLKYLTKGTDAVVSHKLNQPFKSMGSIIVEGADLSFSNAEWFARAAEFASNVDVYPLTNGKVRMAFTFHGITVPLA